MKVRNHQFGSHRWAALHGLLNWREALLLLAGFAAGFALLGPAIQHRVQHPDEFAAPHAPLATDALLQEAGAALTPVTNDAAPEANRPLRSAEE